MTTNAAQRNVKPRFEVHASIAWYARRITVATDDGINEEYEVEVPYGYDVYFPAGHSMRVRTDAELQRLGFTTTGPGRHGQRRERRPRTRPVSFVVLLRAVPTPQASSCPLVYACRYCRRRSGYRS